MDVLLAYGERNAMIHEGGLTIKSSVQTPMEAVVHILSGNEEMMKQEYL
jgi:hypothetical protein